MTKLEGLLREADDRRVRLETRVADAQRLEWALRQRIEELQRSLRDLGRTAAPAQGQPQMPMRQAAQAGTIPVPPPSVSESEAQRVDGDDFAAVLHQSILREQAQHAGKASTAPMQPIPLSPREQAQAYLQQMPQEGAPRRDAAVPPARMHPPAAAAAVPAAPSVRQEDPAPQENEAIVKARALLRAGRSIEQVARETGVEIGALRLMRQMTARD
ncbi:hypothetical protein [Selenomonas sp. F0473]|uniref:hypothetical protein n=1 Tax=Selenomonas sp. F0473 TaxID=999423 RepID=UPI0025FED0D1|nr:hypothetical protein [Selenomonas sp. F0473]